MMKKKLNSYGRTRRTRESPAAATSSSSTAREEDTEWEMRPGGMLVQKRSVKPDAPTPNLRLRIAYGAIRYEICVSSMATFGEVKKVMSGETGLQADEQRLVYRGKERENGEYLDMCGVKDQSKIVLIQDPSSIERRFIQMRMNAKIQSAHRAINDVSVELDQLADQVSAIEKSISNGVKVPEVQITTLIEMLMRQAIKLESISAEGDASALKNLQGKRVQKCVETLDLLKVSNARMNPVVVTTKWETFDHPPSSTLWEMFD
ncbi:BAG family molecular chaperone regulator 2-like [Gastrolobium bilobum]|uniref:BAG family molecular chaperone regulator 2-like n=1 Tax=Gastrolobium bilobum TaxID=150636 RepID=UPI002AB13B00|nr:BAG family molecular chaperone regulator 2-like [Gastrolobium bilobum]